MLYSLGIHHIAAKKIPKGTDAPIIQGSLGPHLDWVWSLIQPIKGSLIASQSFIIIKIELAIQGGNPATQVKNGKR